MVATRLLSGYHLVTAWQMSGYQVVVIPQNGLRRGEGRAGENWNTQRGVQNGKRRSLDWDCFDYGEERRDWMHRTLWKGQQ